MLSVLNDLHMSNTKLSQPQDPRDTHYRKNIELAAVTLKSTDEADVARSCSISSKHQRACHWSIGTPLLNHKKPLKIVKDEFIKHLGASEEECAIKLNHKPPVVILAGSLKVR